MAKKSAARKAVKKATKKAVKKAAKKAAKDAVKKATEGTVKKAAAKKETRYISYVPKTIPTGKILCHGGMIPQSPDQKPGVAGFRPWLDSEANSEKYGPCNCGWSGLPHHMPLAWLEGARKEYDARQFPR